MNLMKASMTGNYPLNGNLGDVDCVVGHSFGTSTGPESVNAALADIAIRCADQGFLIMDETLTQALPGNAFRGPDLSVEGQVSNLHGTGIGTWGTLLAAKEFMDVRGLRRPLMIAQAFHMGRVLVQARKLGLDPVSAPHAPRQFDPESEQPWTRSRAAWVAFAPAIHLALKQRGEL